MVGRNSATAMRIQFMPLGVVVPGLKDQQLNIYALQLRPAFAPQVENCGTYMIICSWLIIIFRNVEENAGSGWLEKPSLYWRLLVQIVQVWYNRLMLSRHIQQRVRQI